MGRTEKADNHRSITHQRLTSVSLYITLYKQTQARKAYERNEPGITEPFSMTIYR
jgi:hypothetical protein